MIKFEYRANDQKGVALEGIVEADSSDAALDALKDRGYTVISLEEKPETLASREIPFFNKIPIKAIVVFSRQFSVLMGAKVPLVQALKTVAHQTQHARLRTIILDLAGEVENGSPLSAAMSAHPNAFSPFFVNMVHSGESSGRLEEVLNYMADQMERDYDLMTKIRGAMTYPIFVIFGLTVVGFIMMVYVVPKLTASLQESGTELPWTTKLLIATSSFMSANLIPIIIALVAAAAAFRWWTSTEGGLRAWDRLKLYIPVFGPLLQRICLVRFTRSFGTMLSGGMDIPTCLDVTAEIVGNAHYRDLILETRREVTDGNSITTVFVKNKTMPSMVPQMMSVGEETGRLMEVLDKLTEFYSRELQNLVTNLVSAIEPLIMLVMGAAVGIMVAAIMLPMYQMATNM